MGSYYPFGLKHKGYNNVVNGRDHKFEYNNKEFEESLGLNLIEMDWRQYDPAIARWIIIDPIIHASLSPYNAFNNNPIFWNDPSGASVTTSEDGNIISYTGEDAKNAFLLLTGGDSHNNSQSSEDEASNGCCNGIKKFFSEVLNRVWGDVTRNLDEHGENFWTGNDGHTYYVTDQNEFYRVYFDRYEKVDELPPMMQQYIALPHGGKGMITKSLANAAKRKAAKTSLVYLAKRGKQIVYIGITNNFARRAATHLRGKHKLAIERIDKSLNSLSRKDARAVEQVLIEFFGLGGKKGQKGQLLNRINSIAEKNEKYAESLRRGKQILEAAGIKF